MEVTVHEQLTVDDGEFLLKEDEEEEENTIIDVELGDELNVNEDVLS